jgi:RNA polymerase sigma-70 factor (ECF subfamily)
LIYSVGIKSGLSDAEAQDVVQETVLSVAKKIEGFVYQPEVCSFKTWMLNLTRWRICNQFQKRQREQGMIQYGLKDSLGEDLLEKLPDPIGSDLDAIWEKEWKEYLYQTASEEVKQKVSSTQFQIFDMLVNERWPVQKVSRTLNATPARIYLIKHRLSRMIQKEIQKLEKGQTAQ